MADGNAPRLAIKAAIKRASLASQDRMFNLDARSQDQLQQIYQQAHDEIVERIHAAGAGDTVRIGMLQRLQGDIDQRLAMLSQTRDGVLLENMRRAAAHGADPFASIHAGELNQISDQAVRSAQAFVDEDGLQLSDRLHRLDLNARQAVGAAVQTAVVKGMSASAAAQAFLLRGEGVPADIQAKIGEAHPEKIAKSAGAALLKNDGNAYNDAKRVFRTEINRAHGTAYQAAAAKTPGAVGTKFNLSPAHPRPDICDLYAKANTYGLGAGVYPFGKSPWPAHPNTLSFETVVFEEEVSQADKLGKEKPLDWLHKQDPRMQEGVLDSRGKAAALRKGLLTPGMIRTPWRLVKQRLEAKGVDIEDLKPSAGNPVDSPAAELRRVRPVGIPVSNALEVRTAKKALAQTLQAIDQVHADGVLPSIPVIPGSSRTTLGRYGYYVSTGKPANIQISSASVHKSLTAAHEIGHFLDHQALYKPGVFASASHPELMGDWLKAIEETAAVKRLRFLRANPLVDIGNGVKFPLNRRHINYLLEPEELWARSYAQYIAMRSGNLKLAAELKDTVQRQSNAPISYPEHWEAGDFAPVAEEIDKVFQAKGWRVSRGR